MGSRNDMHSEWWVRCFRCGTHVALADVHRREALTTVTTLENWFGFTPIRYKHYGLVDLCPVCGAQEDEALQRQRTWMGMAIAAVGVFLFGWGYLGATAGLAVTGVAVIAMLVLLLRRSRTLKVLPPERSRDE